MSRRLLPLLCCLCLAVPARAETLNVGGTDIAYTVPEGYVIGDGPRYAELIEFASRAQPPDIRILSIYATEKTTRRSWPGPERWTIFLSYPSTVSWKNKT